MFRIFISEPILKCIVQSENQKAENARSYLYKLMKEQKMIYTSLESSDTEWIETFKQQFGLTIDTSQSEYIQNIVSNPVTVLQNPSSLFILDIPKANADHIQQEYGVLCMNGENASINCLLDTNDEHTTNDREPLGNGWATVLESLRDIPSNALLLTDRYLFTSNNLYKGEGFINVYNILEVLLPLHFLGEYHVTILFDKKAIHRSYSFNGIVAQLNHLRNALNRTRNYPIFIEVLGVTSDCGIYTDLHNRRIISNYYVVKVEYKLAAFNNNKGTCLQTITPQVLFTEDSLDNHSSPPLKSIEQIVSTLRSFSQRLPNILDHSIYSYAMNGRCLETCTGIKNRLLK